MLANRVRMGRVKESGAGNLNPVVTFINKSDTTISITPKWTQSDVELQYSLDDGNNWLSASAGTVINNTQSNKILMLGKAPTSKRLFTSGSTYNAWVTNATTIEGNLNYLLCDDFGDEGAPTTLAALCYSNMFRDCTSLTTAPDLPATTLANYCYSNMFYNCTGLTTAPDLPATTLASYCYSDMFNNCTGLTTAPDLPATTLVDNCYNSMFQDCTSLTTAPDLPATTLVDYCYSFMFWSCTSLTTAPDLPATTLADYCYYGMFNGCSSFKVSATSSSEYVHSWRIPTSGTGSTASLWNSGMLTDTGGTFTSDPSINTTYYVENTPV